MVPLKLYYDYRDILNAPRIALSGKKISIFIIGNLIGFISYWTLTYFSFSISEYSFYETLNTYGLYPCLFGHTASWISWSIYFFGISIWISFLFLASTAVSRTTLNQLKGDNFFSISDAWKYSLKYWKSIILTPLTIFFIIILFLLIAIFFSLISSISIIGPVIYSLLFPLYFFGSIFTIYTFIVLINSLLFTPSIVATYEEDIMGTIFQSYSISWSQPWRIILYGLTLFILMILGLEIFSWFCINAYNLIFFIFKYAMGDSLIKITNFSSNIISSNFLFENIFKYHSKVINPLSNYYFNLNDTFNNSSYSTSESISLIETFSSVILSVFLFIIALSLISYSLSIFSVGQTITFIIFKKLTDDDELLKRLKNDELKKEDDYFNFDEKEENNNTKNQKS